jgi:hypothetical protein
MTGRGAVAGIGAAPGNAAGRAAAPAPAVAGATPNMLAVDASGAAEEGAPPPTSARGAPTDDGV